LRELRGKTPIGLLAERTGYNRFQIGRWLRDRAEPKLPEFLCLVEAASRRALDLLAGLVDLTQLPSVAVEWQRLCRARDAAYTSPWSHAVLRALELREYASVPATQGQAWLAERLGVSQELVAQGLEVLVQSGQVQKTRGRYRSHHVLSVDTSQDLVRARELRASWAQLAVDRLRAGAPGWYGYTLFSIARADLPRLRALQLEYVHAMQSLIASSEPGELVGLYCAQLLDLGGALPGKPTT
jgi:DNA-binding MarR family transcriptional regulator